MPRRASFFEPETREETVSRLRRLRPNSARRWGRMSAPEMVTHLTDQMTHTLGHASTRLQSGPLRLPLVRFLSIYWVPWPRGLLKGPPEAYVTRPGAWADDLDRLVEMVEAFGDREPEGDWPHHALLGPMRGRDWGVFCHKHFDHHLRQFGV